MSATRPTAEAIAELEAEIREKQDELARLRRESSPRSVVNYRFRGPAGFEITLAELFGGHDELIVIHNMGTSCNYCTLWADGFNGFVDHLQDRAGFAVVSPDSPVTQQAFAAQRGWRFRMVSNGDSGFTQDMGFLRDHNGGTRPAPGVSTFRRLDDGGIKLVAQADFGPGDPFCGIWHLFALLPEREPEWAPRAAY